MGSNEKYHFFLPEFPLLYLCKSMITILFSSYQDAGLVHLLKYMRDADQENWSRLVSTDHIDAATKNVKRLGQAINLAFLVTFAKHLPVTECEMFLNDMNSLEPAAIHKMVWPPGMFPGRRFGKEHNICFTQRNNEAMYWHLSCFLSGTTWWASRLPAFASSCQISVAFSSLNGASSYGPYCVQLMYMKPWEEGRTYISPILMKRKM